MKTSLTMLLTIFMVHAAYASDPTTPTLHRSTKALHGSTNAEGTAGVGLLFTPYGISLGPSFSFRAGNEWIRGGISGNLGLIVGIAVGVLGTIQPELYIGPRKFSMHLGAMGAFAAVFGKANVGTLIAAAGFESEISDRVRIHADVYVPPLIMSDRGGFGTDWFFPAVGARILGPKKKMFVDAQLIFTQERALPVIPTVVIGRRF